MRTLSVRNRIRSLILSICLAAFAAAGNAQNKSAQDTELTLPQARAIAVDALNSRDPETAYKLSKVLSKARPRDPLPYYIAASALAQMGEPRRARWAASRAYRLAQPGSDRFQAADLAAKLAVSENRYSLAQLWLRRAAIHAPDQQVEDQIAKDYKVLRRINPWSFSLRTDVRPSNNVNGGSDSALNIIDGIPDTGTFGPASRALSGYRFALNVAGSYRIRANENSSTSLGTRIYVERVALSSEAKAQAPNVTGSNFASTYGELSLHHAFAVGPRDKGGRASVEFALGENWYGGERYYKFARLHADRSWALSPRTRLTFKGTLERQYKARFSTNNARILGLGMELARGLENGDLLTFDFALRDSQADAVNGTYQAASFRAEYLFRKPIGPARLSLGLLTGYTQYDSYRLSTNPALIGRARDDRSLYGDVGLIFDRYDYAGFVPTLRLRAGRRNSNYSRFESNEVSLTLGIGSKF